MELFDAIKENPVQAAVAVAIGYVAFDHLKGDTKKSREKAEELEKSIESFKAASVATQTRAAKKA